MKLTIDGKTYELDTDWLIDLLITQNQKYLDPASPIAKKYTAERLGVKALLRPKQNKVLQTIAEALGVEDWQTLKPGKHDDILMVLNDLFRQLCLAQTQNLALELTSEKNGHLLGGDAGVKLQVTGAAIGTTALPVEFFPGVASSSDRQSLALASPQEDAG